MNASTHRFLDGFPTEARDRLLASMVHQDFSDGMYLFQEGDAADGVYLVLKGQVEIVRVAGNQVKVLDSIKPDAYFGEVAVLDGLGRSTAARARGATTVSKIPGAAFLEVLASSPGAVTVKLFQHILANLRRLTNQVVDEVVHKEKLSTVGEMANSLMHDLHSPVSNIRLSADMIETNATPDKLPQWCDGIRLQCDRIVGMASELMEFSKGESKLALSKTTTTDFLEQFKTHNAGRLKPSGIEIIYDAQPAEIEIDVLRMQRVLENLVTNAVEALQATKNPRIEIKALVKDSTFCLSVKDNGPGIPAAIRSRIYEPFVTHGKSRGVGLGMAIVRNIVVAHGGMITFQTELNQGTSFLVSLPQKA